MLRAYTLVELVDMEGHLVELVQKVVRELDVRLVYLVDEEHHLLVRGKRLAELTQLDILPDVGDVLVLETGVVQPLHRIVDVKSVLRLSGRLDIPDEQLLAQCPGDAVGKQRLARARLALDDERLADRRIEMLTISMRGFETM